MNGWSREGRDAVRTAGMRLLNRRVQLRHFVDAFIRGLNVNRNRGPVHRVHDAPQLYQNQHQLLEVF